MVRAGAKVDDRGRKRQGKGTPQLGVPMRVASVVAVVTAIVTTAVHARQDPPKPLRKPVAIKGARIYTGTAVIEKGTVLLEGARIKAVGQDVEVPADATIIDASGRVVIPGLVDAGSYLFVPYADASTGGSAEHDVFDAIDTFGRDEAEALAAGVTTVLVRPLARGPLCGLEAVLHLPSRDTQRFSMKRSAALKMSLGFSGGDTSTASQRQADFRSTRQAFDGAKQYKETWDKYKKDLAEYQGKKKQWDEQKQKLDDKTPKPEKKEEGPAKEAPKQADAPKEEPKKPPKPRIDPRNEVLVRALEGQLAVHIEAHAVDSIEHALALAEEFKLKLVIEGATEAHMVAEAIAKAKVPVIVGPVLRYGIPKVEYVNHSVACAAILAKAGVDVAIGSLPHPGAGHTNAGAGCFLLESAATAVAAGLSRERAIRAVTLDAAKIAGLDRVIGSIEVNKLADLVILTGDPFDAGTRVDRTIAAGETVYQRKAE